MRILAQGLFILACSAPCFAHAGGKPVTQATDVERNAARDAYSAAKTDYDAGRLLAALEGFRASYDIVASPNSHLMVGRVLKELHKPAKALRELLVTRVEAVQAAQQSPKLAQKYQRTLSAVDSLIGELELTVARVEITVGGKAAIPVGATLSIRTTATGGASQTETVDNLSSPVILDPGTVVVSLTTIDGTREATVSVERGQAVKVDVVVPKPPPPVVRRDPDPPGSGLGPGFTYASLGVAGAGFLTFGIFGGLTLTTFNDLSDGCPNARCPSSLQGDIDDGSTFQTVANIGLAVGAVGAVGSVVFLLLGTSADETAHIRPGIRPGKNGFLLEGSF